MIIDKNTKPGMYRTTKAHKLKKPDRRLRGGWASTEGIEAGQRILVERAPERRYMDDERLPPRGDEFTFHVPSTYGKDRLEVFLPHAGKPVLHAGDDKDKERFLRDLIADLEPTEKDTAVLHWIEPGFDAGDEVLAILIHAGRVSRDDVRTALAVREAQITREWDIETFEKAWREHEDPTLVKGVPLDATTIGDFMEGQRWRDEHARVCAVAGWEAAKAYTESSIGSLVASDDVVAKHARDFVDATWPKVDPFENDLERARGEWDALRAELADLKAENKKLSDNIGQAIAVLRELSERPLT